MITEQDLMEAIAECQGQRNPNSSTCIKLASFYTILDHLKEGSERSELPRYSFSASPEVEIITYQGDSEFADLIHGMEPNRVWEVVEELMTTLAVINPRLYNGIIRKIKGGI